MGNLNDMAALLDDRFDLVCESMVNGDTIGQMLAKVLPEYKASTAKLGYYRWKRGLSFEMAAELHAAVVDGAESIEEQAGTVIDDAASDRDELQRARFKSGHLQWRAGVRDPKRYRNQAVQATQVNVDLGEVFTKALEAGRERALLPRGEDVQPE